MTPRLQQLAGNDQAFLHFLDSLQIVSVVSFAFGLECAEVPADFSGYWQEGNGICEASAVCSARSASPAPKRQRGSSAVASAAPDSKTLLGEIRSTKHFYFAFPPATSVHRADLPQIQKHGSALAAAENPGVGCLASSNLSAAGDQALHRDVQLQPQASGAAVSVAIPPESTQASGLAEGLVSLLAEHILLTDRAEQVARLTGAAAAAYYAMVKRHLSTFSVSTLRGAASAWRRWSAWSQACHATPSLLPADAVSVQLFLEAVRAGTGVDRRNAGGVHAVERIHAGLAFLATHLRLPIELDFAKPAGAAGDQPPPRAHTNAPLWLQDLALAREVIDSTSNQVLKFCGLLILVLFTGGVRFAHAQRSKLASQTDEGLIFRCHRGKSRRKGQAAPPFEWACPHSSLFTPAHQGSFIALLEQVVPAGQEFLVPTLEPYRSTLHQATGFGTQPCSDSGWRAMLRSFVALAPAHWHQRHPGDPCARSTRRTLATIAEVLGLSHSERLPLGSWVDPLGKEGNWHSRMPSTYVAGETRMWSQVASKHRVASAVGDLLSGLTPAEFSGQAWEGLLADTLQASFHSGKQGALKTPVATPLHGLCDAPVVRELAMPVVPPLHIASHERAPKAPVVCPLHVLGHASSSGDQHALEAPVGIPLHAPARAPPTREASASPTSPSSSSSSSSSSAEGQLPDSPRSPAFSTLPWILHIRARGGPAFLHRCVFDLPGDERSRRPMCCKPCTTGLLFGTGLAEAAQAAVPFSAQWCRRCAADVHAVAAAPQ